MKVSSTLTAQKRVMVILTVFVLAFLTAHIYFDWSLKPASKPLFALVSFIAVIGLVGVLFDRK